MQARLKQPDEVEVAVADADVVGLFMALETQWTIHAMTGMRLGINYTAIAPTAALYGIDMRPEMMTDLRIMEAAALDEFGKQQRRAAR